MALPSGCRTGLGNRRSAPQPVDLPPHFIVLIADEARAER
jgi:hypothetical protein